VLYFDVVLGFFEGEPDLLPSEDVPVEILAENLGRLVIDLVLGVDHDAVLSPGLVEYLADDLGVAGVDEDQLGHLLLLVAEQLSYLFSGDGAELSDGKFGVVLELELSFFGAVADDVEDLGLLVGDEVLEVLLGGDLAVQGYFRFVGVLSRRKGTLRAD